MSYDQPHPGQNPYGHDPYGQGPGQNPYQPHAGEVLTEKPKSVRLAVTLIWVGVGLGVLNTLLGFVMLDSLIDASLESQPEGAATLDRDTLRAAVIGGLAFGLVISVAIAALFAVFIGKGHNWARITYTVLAALGLVFGLVGIANQPPLLLVGSLVGWVLSIAIIVLLFQRDSNAWFRRPR